MKVGDYVRFKTLSREIKIGKVIEIIAPDKNSMRKYCVYDLDNNEVTVDDYIIKSSPNIIDLIEVGDYVNGQKIVDIGCLTNGPRKGTKVIDYYITPNAVSYLENEDIKSVITHEQMEQMAYKVNENGNNSNNDKSK